MVSKQERNNYKSLKGERYVHLQVIFISIILIKLNNPVVLHVQCWQPAQKIKSLIEKKSHDSPATKHIENKNKSLGP